MRPPACFEGVQGRQITSYCGAAVVGAAGGPAQQGTSTRTFAVVQCEINIYNIPHASMKHAGASWQIYGAVS